MNPSTSCMALDSGLGQLDEKISEEVPRHFTGVRTRPSLGLTVVVCGQYSAWSRTNSTSSSGSLLMRKDLNQMMILIVGNLLISNSIVPCSRDCSLGTILAIFEKHLGLLSNSGLGIHIVNGSQWSSWLGKPEVWHIVCLVWRKIGLPVPTNRRAR